jgi:putative acetyltransferase
MIREYNPINEERDRIMAIWLTATLKAHPFIDHSYWMQHYDTVKNHYLTTAKTYVYTQNDRVLGFISIKDGDTIGALFVDVHQQHRGVGSALLRHVQGLHDDLRLFVYAHNKRAVTFYKKAGFTVENEHTDGGTGEPELLLRWIRPL